MTVIGLLDSPALYVWIMPTKSPNVPEKPSPSLFPTGHISLLGQESIFLKMEEIGHISMFKGIEAGEKTNFYFFMFVYF